MNLTTADKAYVSAAVAFLSVTLSHFFNINLSDPTQLIITSAVCGLVGWVLTYFAKNKPAAAVTPPAAAPPASTPAP